jgi:glutamine cyclotransferase
MRAIQTPGIATIHPKVLRTLAHDPGAHTQGLAYADGQLYESTGLVGASTLRRIDIQSGRVQQMIPVDRVWAEGIAVCAGRLVQITYTEGLAICYRLPALRREASFSYQGEGWGLAAAGGGYVMSDGSDVLQFRNSAFEPLSRLQVRIASRALRGLNDLECLGRRIFACALLHTDIYEIDAQSGGVLRIIDCSEIVERSGRDGYMDVLNGIAFAPDRGTFFVTGKNWPTLFELEWPV